MNMMVMMMDDDDDDGDEDDDDHDHDHDDYEHGRMMISLKTSDDFCKSADFVRDIRRARSEHQRATEGSGAISPPCLSHMLAHTV
jgi:hypothetical protein